MRIKSVFILCVAAVLVTSIASAKVTSVSQNAQNPTVASRVMNPFTCSMTVTDLGGLQARLQIFASNATGTATVADDIVWVYGQLYDYPWAGGPTTWSPPGSNTFCQGREVFYHPLVDGHSFSPAWTFTVPLEQQYQGWGMVIGGRSFPGPTYIFYTITQRNYLAGTQYILTVHDATPTPYLGGGGSPVPTLSMPGLLLLGMILAGVGVILLRRS